MRSPHRAGDDRIRAVIVETTDAPLVGADFMDEVWRAALGDPSGRLRRVIAAEPL